jgi:predicted dinucleotide-binding enzyme
MKIAILGSGIVAKTVAGKLDALGHQVVLGTRDVAATLARDAPDMAGGPPLRTWLESHPKVRLVTFAEAAGHGELAFNALSGAGAIDGLRALAGALADKILVDISNPLDFSKGMPPSLSVANTDSLGEQIQRALPDTRVVKTLNTVAAFLMIEPRSLHGGDHSMLLCGNDAAAKAVVTNLLTEGFGWQDVIDLGGLDNARGLEMWVPLWARLFGALGTPMFGLKIVR